MTVLIHADPWDKTHCLLEKEILAQLPGTGIMRSRSVRDLSGHLNRPMNGITVVVLFTGSRMEKILGLKGMVEGKKLILMLQEQTRDLFHQGLELNPSYIGDALAGSHDLLLVLKRIAETTNRTIKR